MSPASDQPRKNGANFSYNVAVALILGQVGCLTTIIVIAALFGGLWLDNYFHTKPLFTVGLIVVSVPVTSLMMFWIIRSASSKFAKVNKPDSNPQVKEDRSSEN